jgi:glycosyltransferase involved in cell wall biosynthesis
MLGWPVLLLPPGVDLATYRPVSPDRKLALRRQLGLPEREFILLHAGHLNRGRGVGDLLAVADLAAPVLACSTSTAQDQVLANELRAKGVRVLTEYIPRIADLYAAADAYLFPVPPDPRGPSSIDAPLSVLEAAACGLPVVTTRFGALPSLWPDAGNGERPDQDLFYYDDIGSLRRAVACLQDGRTARQPGPRRLVEQFSWEKVAGQLLQSLTGEDAKQ